tara:strand:+ start:630 stop:812 length:183 start_codon:yes stop_codon:yes gene_type:complete
MKVSEPKQFLYNILRVVAYYKKIPQYKRTIKHPSLNQLTKNVNLEDKKLTEKDYTRSILC